MTSKRERYTPTDIGPTPKHWGDPFLEDVASFISNGFVGTATPFYATSEDESAVPYLYGTNVRVGGIDRQGIRYITAAFHRDQKKTKLRTNDLLTVQSGHIGTTAVVTPEYDGANCHALIITRLDQSRMHAGFLSQYLNSEIGKARMRGLEVGSTILHINTKDFKKFRVPQPPLIEQERIAEALSTWDTAVEKTEALLANAEMKMRALMQQLLTGRRRFSASTRDDWARVSLSIVFDRVRRKNTIGNRNVLTISGRSGVVPQGEYFNKNVAAADISGYTLLQGGEFAYNKSYSDGYPLGAIKMLRRGEVGVLSSLYICFKMRDADTDCADFYRHWFEFGGLNRELSVVAQEGARNHGLLNVGIADFFNLQTVRPTLDEQRDIAGVLNDGERQVCLLKIQLERLAVEKRALLQQLLTGKRRISENDCP